MTHVQCTFSIGKHFVKQLLDLVSVTSNKLKVGGFGTIQTKTARFFRRVLSVPEHSRQRIHNAGRHRNTRAMIGIYVIMC